MDWRRVARGLRPEQSHQPALSHQAPSQIAQADDVYSAGLARPISSHEAILVHPEDAIERPSGDAGHQGRVGAEVGGHDDVAGLVVHVPPGDRIGHASPGVRVDAGPVLPLILRPQGEDALHTGRQIALSHSRDARFGDTGADDEGGVGRKAVPTRRPGADVESHKLNYGARAGTVEAQRRVAEVEYVAADPADLPSIDQVARGGPGHRLEDVIVVDTVIRSR